MEIIARTKVIRVGDSLYIILPAHLAKVMNIGRGTELKISKEGEKIIYEKQQQSE